MGISGSIDHASETSHDRHDLTEDEAVVMALERYKAATGMDLPESEVRDAVRKRMADSRTA